MKPASGSAGDGAVARDLLFEDDGRECPAHGLAAVVRPNAAGSGSRRLFTAILDLDGAGDRPSLAFCAIVSGSRRSFLGRLAARYGGWIASEAVVTEGVDHADSRVAELVTPSLMALLDEAASPTGSGSAAEFDVTIERRFA
ncbi:hypothetical protein ACFSC3_08035 [Sphingomonas floccifaciens]|uniref:Uncharacterized protein n=1 Tax=Sphingomonas floccifaciens TaxID=1844115 RepID=A0ABW4NBJ4_9SPHN